MELKIWSNVSDFGWTIYTLDLRSFQARHLSQIFAKRGHEGFCCTLVDNKFFVSRSFL